MVGRKKNILLEKDKSLLKACTIHLNEEQGVNGLIIEWFDAWDSKASILTPVFIFFVLSNYVLGPVL